MLPPNVRNSMAKVTCMSKSDAPVPACAHVQWHPAEAVTCTFQTATGVQHTGICDPNGYVRVQQVCDDCC